MLLSVFILAAALRFYRLDTQSFWNDEGNSARIAERSLRLILEGAEGDIHPPGYYILLHYWRAVAGQSEYALRSLSAMTGVLLVGVAYLLGRRAFSLPTGLGAAFLTALAPLGIYYSQEARMYSLLGLLAAASTYLLLRALSRPGAEPAPSISLALRSRDSWSLWGYIVAAAAGLYVHYAFALVLLAHNAIFCLWWIAAYEWTTDDRRWTTVGTTVCGRRRPWSRVLTRVVQFARSPVRLRSLLVWIGVNLCVITLYLPWLRTAVGAVRPRVLGWPAGGTAVGLGPALADVFRVIVAGVTVETSHAREVLLAAAVLVALGLAPTRRDRLEWLGAAAMCLALFVPVGLILALGLYKAAWLKLLIVVLAPALVLAVHGAENLVPAGSLEPRRRSLSTAAFLIALAALGVGLAPSLRNLYTNPVYARDDYRQIATDIAATKRSNDGIVLNAPNQWEVFTYYFADDDVHPAPYRPEAGEVEAFLVPFLGRYRRLFVLYWGHDESDPHQHIETWLADKAYKASDRWYGRVRLATYAVAELPAQPAAMTGAEFGDRIGLLGYAVSLKPYHPGEIVPVTLFWVTREAGAPRYKVTLQLLDRMGELVAQHDSEPGGGRWPTSDWKEGQVVLDRHGIEIGANMAPGRYTLIAALYDAASGERLPVSVARASAGDFLALDTLEVAR